MNDAAEQNAERRSQIDKYGERAVDEIGSAERRATVERIRDRLCGYEVTPRMPCTEVKGHAPLANGVTHRSNGPILAILDAEAKR